MTVVGPREVPVNRKESRLTARKMDEAIHAKSNVPLRKCFTLSFGNRSFSSADASADLWKGRSWRTFLPLRRPPRTVWAVDPGVMGRRYFAAPVGKMMFIVSVRKKFTIRMASEE